MSPNAVFRHDSAGQLLLPGGPLGMLDHNEVFNTGYVEGDGGVMCKDPDLPDQACMHAWVVCVARLEPASLARSRSCARTISYF